MSWDFSAGNKTAAFGTSLTPTATLPGVNTGDLMVALVQATTNNATLNSNDGWTLIQRSSGGTGGSTHHNTLWQKVAAGGQSLSPTWTIGTSAQWTVVIFAIGNPDATPLDASTAFLNQSTGTPSITATTGGRLIVCTAFSRATCNWTNEQIDGSTTGVTEAGQATTSAQNAGCMWFVILADGTTGAAHSGTATFSSATVPYMDAASFKEAAAAATKAPPPLQPRWRRQTRARVA